MNTREFKLWLGRRRASTPEGGIRNVEGSARDIVVRSKKKAYAHLDALALEVQADELRRIMRAEQHAARRAANRKDGADGPRTHVIQPDHVAAMERVIHATGSEDDRAIYDSWRDLVARAVVNCIWKWGDLGRPIEIIMRLKMDEDQGDGDDK